MFFVNVFEFKTDAYVSSEITLLDFPMLMIDSFGFDGQTRETFKGLPKKRKHFEATLETFGLTTSKATAGSIKSDELVFCSGM